MDISLKHEVTHTDFDLIRGCNAYTNVGINNRGTVMLTNETIQITNITKVPSGRTMAEYGRSVWVVYIYMSHLAHPTDG
jgi:hypothetical protein